MAVSRAWNTWRAVAATARPLRWHGRRLYAHLHLRDVARAWHTWLGVCVASGEIGLELAVDRGVASYADAKEKVEEKVEEKLAEAREAIERKLCGVGEKRLTRAKVQREVQSTKYK